MTTPVYLAMQVAVVGLSLIGPGWAGEPVQWHPGMTATFSGFLCHAPTDAVHGLVAALEVPGTSPISAFEAVETPLHCFYSDGPLKFLGRIANAKTFVDPEKGRFVFVQFGIGGNVTAYSWIAEAFVSDQPYVPNPPLV